MSEMPANYTPKTPVARLKQIMAAESVQEQFENALKDQAPLFMASIIDLYGADPTLQKCDPSLLVQECLKAATLRLPISKSLGFAYVVPYKGKIEKNRWQHLPQFQIGYRGLVQLAIRSGQYRHLNADCVYIGEEVEHDRLTGEVTITGEPEGDYVIGFFAFLELVNGFRKSIYWTREQVEAHAKRYSQAWGRKGSAWETDFEAMGRKTVLKALLSRYGLLSIEMMTAWEHDERPTPVAEMQDEIEERANRGEVLDLGEAEVESSQDAPPTQEAPEAAQEQPAGPAF